MERLLHAFALPAILTGGVRVLMILNEHPKALERLAPNEVLKDRVRVEVARCREATKMTKNIGRRQRIDGKPGDGCLVLDGSAGHGTVAYWLGGVIVAFSNLHLVNGRLALAPGVRNVGGRFAPGVGMMPFAGMTSLSFGVGGNDFGHGF